MLPATPRPSTIFRPAIFRRICSWCHCDLGVLTCHGEQASYGICQDCAHRYFAELYDVEDMEVAELRELTIGGN